MYLEQGFFPIFGPSFLGVWKAAADLCISGRNFVRFFGSFFAKKS